MLTTDQILNRIKMFRIGNAPFPTRVLVNLSEKSVTLPVVDIIYSDGKCLIVCEESEE